jgi:hypothetical protein
MRYSTNWLTFIIITGLLLAAPFASRAQAEKAAISKAQLQTDATDIVSGAVRAILSSTERKGEYEVTKHVAEIVIETVEKGSSLTPGNLVYARYWTQAWRRQHAAGHPRPRSDTQEGRLRPRVPGT